MKSTIRIYHREGKEYLIVVCPDGKIFLTSFWGHEEEELFPCYGSQFYLRSGQWRSWSQYPTERAAIRAMRAYGKNVKFVGAI